MSPVSPTRSPALRRIGWKEAGPLITGFVLAMQSIQAIANDIAVQHDIGGRGALILVLIADGVIHPLELATRLGTGRSVITNEVGRLVAADLVTRRIAASDRRFVELGLTREGERASAILRDRFANVLTRGLGCYTSGEVDRLSRMLNDIRRSTA